MINNHSIITIEHNGNNNAIFMTHYYNYNKYLNHLDCDSYRIMLDNMIEKLQQISFSIIKSIQNKELDRFTL